MATTMTNLTMDTTRAKKFFEEQMAFTTGPVELERMRKNEDVNIVDVRAPEDYQQGHIPGAVNLPKEKWNTMEGLQKGKVNVVYCYTIVCHLAKTAAIEFTDKGYSVMELEGGFETWKEHEFEIER